MPPYLSVLEILKLLPPCVLHGARMRPDASRESGKTPSRKKRQNFFVIFKYFEMKTLRAPTVEKEQMLVAQY